MKPRNLIETASIAAAAVLALGLAGSVPAAPILNVMTNNGLSSGAPAMPDWNEMDVSNGSGQNNTNGTSLAKTYSALAGGSITTTLSTIDFPGTQLACRSNRGSVANGGAWANLYCGIAFTGGGKLSVTLSNSSGTPIAPNTAYQLTVYAYDGGSGPGSVYFTTDAAGTQFVKGGTQAASTISWVTGHVFTANDTYASLTFNITSDGSGQIKFYDLNNGSPNGNRLSGFQLMEGASGYAAWATANAGGQTPSEDFNHDGVQNGVAYFMGMNGLAILPGVVNGKVTWPHVGTVTAYQVQVSTDLVNWTAADPAAVDSVTNPAQIVFTLPVGAARTFCRLSVTP